MYYIGVDIGGMSVKTGLVNDEGKVLYKTRVKTVLNDPEKVISDIGDMVDEVLYKNNLTINDIAGIGIGSPGIISSAIGRIDRAYNLGWVNVDIVDMLKKRFETIVKVSNDANVAALGEAIFGVAKGYNDVVMLTLGTGVGGGVIINKKLYEGGASKGTELGHVTLILGGEPCSCGRSGCIEAYTSATALIRDTKRAMEADKSSKMWELVGGDIEKTDGLTSFTAFKDGDKAATKVVNNYVMYLAESMMSFMNIFRPEAMVIGGGISGQGQYFADMIKDYLEAHDYGFKNAPKAEILIAKNGNDAGIIGAAALIKA